MIMVGGVHPTGLTKPDFSDGATWMYANEALDAYRDYELCVTLEGFDEFSLSECVAPLVDYGEVVSRFYEGESQVFWHENSKKIISHVIPARTKALGQIGGAVLEESPVDGSESLAGFTDSNQGHSAQFHGYHSELSVRSKLQDRASYWRYIVLKGVDASMISGLY